MEMVDISFLNLIKSLQNDFSIKKSQKYRPAEASLALFLLQEIEQQYLYLVLHQHILCKTCFFSNLQSANKIGISSNSIHCLQFYIPLR